jgi:hypothetical protein
MIVSQHLLYTKKQISPRMNTDDADFKLEMTYRTPFLIRVNQCYLCDLW